MNVENIVPMRLPPSSNLERREAHVSVLAAELVSSLAPREGGLYVDATLGAGGHAEAILEVPGTRLIGLDRDAGALALAAARLERFGDRVTLLHGRFSEIAAHLASVDTTGVLVDGLYADVGVSSMQLDDPARGMSFRSEGPLDMRMDRRDGETALELIARLDDDELADILFQYGEERRSRRVARCIKQSCDAGELVTTMDLRRAVVRAVGPARHGGVDPATRTFQALRIAVNGELAELEALLAAAPSLVAPGGTFAVIAFHSLEDRLVKQALRDRAIWQPLSKKPIVATDREVTENPRSRSAKLRAAHRQAIDGGDDDGSSFALDDEPSREDGRDDEVDA